MKLSVLVIAHNEERHISECLSSLMNQTRTADEIILVVHNSTDKTEEIAKQFPIKVINLSDKVGSIYSRIESMRHATGDIILCTDGDSVVSSNWIETMSETLQKGNVLVGSWIKMKGTFYNSISNTYNKLKCIESKNPERWIWGASFAFWGRDKDRVCEILKKTEELSNKLNLTRNPDDYWLALFMKKQGRLEVTNETFVSPYAKERSSISAILRNLENRRNGKKIRSYLKMHSDISLLY